MPQPGRPPRSSAPEAGHHAAYSGRASARTVARRRSCSAAADNRSTRRPNSSESSESGPRSPSRVADPAEGHTGCPRQWTVPRFHGPPNRRSSIGQCHTASRLRQAALIHNPFRHCHDSRLNPATARWRRALGTVHVGRGSGRELRGRAGPAANGRPEGEPRQPVAAGPFEITVCAWTVIGRFDRASRSAFDSNS